MKNAIYHFLIIAVALAAGATFGNAQDLPNEIRGYKVHDADVRVTNQTDPADKKKPDARVQVTDPVLVDKSLSGLTFEVLAELDPLGNSGSVDFLVFQDIRINGIPATVDEYTYSFEFKKKQTQRLPMPVRVSVGTLQTLRGALGEIRNSKQTWQVTGTVFVFGRFKKWGMNFKRVVPVQIDLAVRNPLQSGSVFGASESN